MNVSEELSFGRNDALILRVLELRPDWMDRILGRLDGYPDPGACWDWTMSRSSKGYGRCYTPRDRALSLESRNTFVHRAVWLAIRGPIPSNMVLDHDGPYGCGNKACANPSHLQVVTNRHNTVLSPGAGVAYINAAKTHCLRGHRLGGENTTAWATRAGFRGCRTCEDMRQAERHRTVRAAAKALGMGWNEYLARHGGGIVTARRVLQAVQS